MRADHLQVVREPLRWRLQFGDRANVSLVEEMLRGAAAGPIANAWTPPEWLLSHQIDAARRVAASIDAFQGALLADAVGLGKTYVALAVATLYPSVAAVVPATLVSQWKRVSARVGVAVTTVSHEALSRGARVPAVGLIVVDEAHKFRNPNTRRYDNLARGVKKSRVLLLTATPVVNRPADFVNLLRLFASDGSFSPYGMASMEQTLTNRDYQLLTRAAAAAVVARSPEIMDGVSDILPRVRDGAVVRPPSVEQDTMLKLLPVIDALEVPGAFESPECALLRLHLLHRLASSAAAFKDTVRRHSIYTERALSSHERGEALSRSLARRIFATEDELQFAFGDFGEQSSTEGASSETLRADRDRLLNLSKLLSKTNGASPKSEVLARILRERTGKKTIVFATAVATALELARWLGWKETAVVGAGKGWIASGALPVDEVLALFAPGARGKPEPHRSLRISTLIATDLASEGLDLQDADAVVHYDLPWTPLKLEQRVGRIARLGSEFSTADVYWFAPPEILERRLRLETRISAKVQDQIGLHVPATSSVGRARILNEGLLTREQLNRDGFLPDRQAPRFAVSCAPPNAIFAIRWHLGNCIVPELIALGGDRLEQISDYAAVGNVLTELSEAAPSTLPPPEILVERILQIIRARLSTIDRGNTCQFSRRFRRRIMALAYVAGKERDLSLLSALDAVLNRLRLGLNSGGERSLADLLARKPSRREITTWLAEQPALETEYPTFEIVAALFGDGSTNVESDRVRS